MVDAAPNTQCTECPRAVAGPSAAVRKTTPAMNNTELINEISKYETAPIFEHATSKIATKLKIPTIDPMAIPKSFLLHVMTSFIEHMSVFNVDPIPMSTTLDIKRMSHPEI